MQVLAIFGLIVIGFYAVCAVLASIIYIVRFAFILAVASVVILVGTVTGILSSICVLLGLTAAPFLLLDKIAKKINSDVYPIPKP